MIRVRQIVDDREVAPQAIFWRPLTYFTKAVRNSSDDLDEYTFASFEIGNWLSFDLRHYRGFPELTVTLYLSLGFDDANDIQYAINRVVDEFSIPKLAVAWRRGQPFTYGELNRPGSDRLREPEARILALKVAADQPNRQASTDVLINAIPRLTALSDVDMRPSLTRPAQPQWHQIVRNVISHRANPIGPFKLGYATRIKGGLAVTQKGVEYLRGLGFLV